MSSTKQQRVKSGKKNKPSPKDKQALLLKERVMKIKRDVLKTVELMLEANISEKWFLQNCAKLCKQDYADIIQERSIEHVCGYPLCDKPIKTITQQYHISCITNKVYDITERKCFCCNECYKASNYIKTQLPDLPLYMRKAEIQERQYKLLCDSVNKGSVGEEVIFNRSISKEDVEETIESVALESVANHLSNILQEDIKGCVEHLGNLKITENVYEKAYVFHLPEQNKATDSDDTSSESLDDDDIDEDNKRTLFPEYDNVSILSNKLMPIPGKTKKAVLISPIKPMNTPESPAVKLSIEFVNNVFQDWFTEDTMKYLLGERKMYSLKADMLFQTMISSDIEPKSEKLSSIKKEYIDLCLKIDKLPEENSDSLEEDIPEDITFYSKTKETDSDVFHIKPNSKPSSYKPRPKGKSKGKKKTVSFEDQNEKQEKELSKIQKAALTSASEEPEVKHVLSEPAFPLVDSVSQNALRKQLLSSKLKAVYFDMLPIIGLHYRDIRDGVTRVLDTLSLTPTNVTYKPKEWKCIALVLFRILTKTTHEELQHHEYFDFSKLSDSVLKQLSISISEIEELASDLISSNQLQRLQGSYN
ncbi:putative RNA polymerase II subunit B1 CTD phosphatase RPAP2 [Nephila pilipes]|uniref:RNA polymerase II subunit B1 CTD phosphatase RPAP2 homolog n=1 Tax=Nephila pilipes TaxID=299642 RepID=A0A8X6TB73_NEPPI|nr:putative RNA polymerase II subunit B1 CTD phosphatase RPAP2 [Nephila pilipes]